ncbi:MAG TPA: PilZ domain-containing protein [Pyrinomonadaceae bacterium]|nr:PilZ domain-containing protein [Pyrinomonadaceae bacterium]
MSEQRYFKRIRERLPLTLPVRVRGRDTTTFEWTEVTRLTNVTPFGAGFTLRHPTEKGRLLHMTIPMPRQLRVFDHVEDQYKIWAVVRYIKTSIVENKTVFEVGVAFIGKRPPASYEKEPWTLYDVTNTTFEATKSADEIVIPFADQRAYTRHNIAVDMRIEIVNEAGNVIETEQTVTENISAKGATLFTTLEVPSGRFVRLTSEQYRITVHAAIRSRSKGADGVPRIHVEFIDKEWPL